MSPKVIDSEAGNIFNKKSVTELCTLFSLQNTNDKIKEFSNHSFTNLIECFFYKQLGELILFAFSVLHFSEKLIKEKSCLHAFSKNIRYILPLKALKN